MANEKEELLFEVVFDAKGAEENVVRFKKRLIEIKAERAALDKSFKNGEVSIDGYAKALAKLDASASEASKGLQEQNKAINDNAKAQKAAEGSIAQMRARLSLLTAEYIELSKVERENVETGGKLLLTLRSLSDELKENEKAMGDNRRNVGNYGASIKDVNDRIAELTEEYNGLNKAQRDNAQVGGVLLENIKSLKEEQKENEEQIARASKTTSDYVKELNIMGVNVGQVTNTLKSGGQGVLGFAKSVFSAKGALTALTAVPIILVLSAIVGFLTKSKDGMEFLGRKTAAVTAIFNLFLGKVVEVGRGIVEALSNPGKAIADLGKAIQENLTNRFKAFGLIIQAVRSGSFKDFANAVLQLGTGVEDVVGKVEDLGKEAANAAAKGEAVAAAAQKIADAERALNVERSKSRAEIERNKLLAEDITKTQQQRETAAKAAFAIENGLLQQSLSLQQRKIANIKDEISLGQATGEALDKLAEAESHLGELREESLGKQTELNNKVNQIRIEGAKAAMAAQIAVLNEGLRVTQERGFQTLEIEKKILSQQLQLDLVGIVKGSDQEKALRLKFKADLAQLIYNDLVKQNARQTQLEIDAIDARLVVERQGSMASLKIQKEKLALQAFQERATIELTVKNEEEKAARLGVIDAKYLADKKEINRQIQDVEIKALDDLLAARLARTVRGSKAEYKVQIEQIRKRIKDALQDERVGAEEFQKVQAEGFKELADLESSRVATIANAITDSLGQVSSGISKLVEAQITRQTNALDQQQKAVLASAGLSADARTRIEEQFQKKREKLEKDAAEKRRRIATLENLISTARGITNAFTLPPPLSFINAALVAANGIAQQVVISSQQFAKGTVLEGPSHAGGGIQLFNKQGHHFGEAEGDEMILTKGVWRNPVLRAQASALNIAGGGRSLMPGSEPLRHVRPHFALGGALSNFVTPQAASQIDYNKIAAAVAAMPAPVVYVDSLRNGIGKEVKVESRADA